MSLTAPTAKYQRQKVRILGVASGRVSLLFPDGFRENLVPVSLLSNYCLNDVLPPELLTEEERAKYLGRSPCAFSECRETVSLGTQKRYCSKNCVKRAWRRRHRGYNRERMSARRNTQYETRICASLSCSNSFETYLSSRKRFCAPQCRVDRAEETRTCAAWGCRKRFVVSPNSTQRYCCKSHQRSQVRRDREGIQRERRYCKRVGCQVTFNVNSTSRQKYCCRSCQKKQNRS